MSIHVKEKRYGWRDHIRATTGIALLAVPIIMSLITTTWLQAQAPTGKSSNVTRNQAAFEVASIKQDHSGNDPMSIHTAPDRFTATNVTTKFLIEFAYNLQPFQHSGGPSWIGSETYDIEAKEEDAVGDELEKLPPGERIAQIRLMLQSLLADRFKLKVSHQMKEGSVYTLVVAKNGPMFSKTKATSPDLTGGNGPSSTGLGKGVWVTSPGQLVVNEAPFGNFVTWLSRQPEISSMISDQTGLTGDFYFTLQWAPSLGQAPIGQASASTPLPDSSGPSIFTALQEQLGLRLETKKGPVDTLIIDSIEKPSPN